MSFDAGAITGSLKLDLSDYAHGILEAQSVSAIFPQIVTEFMEQPLLGLIGLAKEVEHAIAEMTLEAARHFQDLNLAAQRAGVDVSWMSEMSRLAGTVGVAMDSLVNGFKVLERQVEAAQEGQESAVKGFERLGISVREAGQLMAEPQALFERVQGAIDAIADPTERTAAALGVLGRQGFQMVPFLTMSAEKAGALKDIYKALGGTIGEEQARMGQSFADLESIFGAAFDGIKEAVAEPILKYMADHAAELIPKIVELSGAIRGQLATAMPQAIDFARDLGKVLTDVGTIGHEVFIPMMHAIADVTHIVAGTFQEIKEYLGPVVDLMTHFAGDVAATMHPNFAAGSAGVQAPASAGVLASAAQLVFNNHVEPVDPDEASTRIADKIRPAVRKAAREHQQQMERAAADLKVKDAFKGR